MIHKINKVANERTNNEGAKLIIYPYYLLLIRTSKVPKCILSEFDQQVGHFITNALSTSDQTWSGEIARDGHRTKIST